jgi:outer membrane protein
MVKHPSLRAMSYGLEAADKQVDSQRAGHLPQFSLQLSETYADNSGYDNRVNPRYEVGTVGVQVSVPIFSGGGIEAGVDSAIAKYHVSLEKRNEKLREIEREIRTAYLQLKTSYARMASTAKEVDAREKVTEGQSKNYQLGVITIVDLLEVKKDLLKSYFELSKSRYEYVKQWVALKLWSGSLQRSDVEEINGWLVKG